MGGTARPGARGGAKMEGIFLAKVLRWKRLQVDLKAVLRIGLEDKWAEPCIVPFLDNGSSKTWKLLACGALDCWI